MHMLHWLQSWSNVNVLRSRIYSDDLRQSPSGRCLRRSTRGSVRCKDGLERVCPSVGHSSNLKEQYENVINEEIRARACVTNITEKIRETVLRWFGHLERKTDEEYKKRHVERSKYRRRTRPENIGLYRDVWIAEIAWSRTSLDTQTVVMCSTSQCKLRSLHANSGMWNVICIVTSYTLPPYGSLASISIAMAFSR